MLRIVLAVLALVVVLPVGLYAWTRISPRTIHTEIEINATPERVWQVLADFGAYPEWNPFIVSAEGEPRRGATLTNRLSNDGKIMTFSPTVLVAEPGRELRWIGRLWVPGLVDGEHFFRLEPAGDGRTRLVQGETFYGALVPFVGSALDVKDGFAAMNAALKIRAEKMTG